ncbi:MAG: SBBP repeat-containing protein [Bacteroidetes bacterium]|nr:SBBP repeat-containing protein [Bacteroidota bacterium]
MRKFSHILYLPLPAVFPFLLFISTLTLQVVKAQENFGYEAPKPGSVFPSAIAPSLMGNGMCFTENKGQIIDMNKQLRPDVLYKGDGGGTDVYIRKTGISYVITNMADLIRNAEENADEAISKGLIRDEADEQLYKDNFMQNSTLKGYRVDVNFSGCNENIQTINNDKIPGLVNFYKAYCPEGITGITQYNKITYKNVYKGIDIVYYGGKEHGLKYDIIVNPGGRPGDIKLTYSGMDNILMNEDKIQVKTEMGVVLEWIPKVYQNIDGKEIAIRSTYKRLSEENGNTRIGFNISNYNRNYPLIIDPWITYYGGSGADVAVANANDKLGNIITTGRTSSINFPVTVGVFQTAFSAASYSDAFVVSFQSNGNIRNFATYYGASQGLGICSDASNNVIFCGNAVAGFPIGNVGLNVVHQPFYGIGFIVKLNNLGMRQFSTFYNGVIRDVRTDNQNNIVGVGETSSAAGISTAGAFQSALGGSATSKINVFIVKFQPNGQRIWGTYFGGNNSPNVNNDKGNGIAVDQVTNEIYITGATQGNFPVTAGCHQFIFGGGSISNVINTDAFLAKFLPGGNRLWATYYGGNQVDFGAAIAVDGAGDIIIVGSTCGPGGIGLFATAGAFQTAFGGGYADGFVAKFDANGVRKWGTLLGGTGSGSPYDEEPMGVDCDVNNNIVVGGDTYSHNFPVTSCAYQTVFAGTEDNFITTLDQAGNLLCSGFIGTGNSSSPNNESGHGGGGCISVFGCYAYLAGTSACTYPVTPGAFQTTCGGVVGIEGDATISQFNIKSCGLSVASTQTVSVTTSSAVSCACNGSATLNLVAGCKIPPFSYYYNNGMQTINTSSSSNTVNNLCPGTYTYTVTMTCDTLYGNFTIAGPAATFVPNITIVNASCSSSTGSFVITSVTNGNPVYTISEGVITIASNVNTPYTVSSVSVGTHIYVITGSNGCSTSFTINITNTGSKPNVNAGLMQTITCTNPVKILNGSSSTIGAIPSWTGPGIVSGANTFTPSVNAPGTYTLTVSDGACVSISTVVVTQSPLLGVGFSLPKWTCPPDAATATASAVNGTSPYNYLWSNGKTTVSVSGLNAGTYVVTINDANGCTATGAVNVQKLPLPLDTSSFDGSCSVQAQASVTPHGGILPYTYNWSNGSTNSSIVNVAAGYYTVSVSDATGCITTRTFQLQINKPVFSDFTVPSLACLGSLVTFTNIGTQPGSGITYNWFISPINVSGTTSNFSYTFLSAGTYGVNLNIGNGSCNDSKLVNITVINCSGPTITTTGSSVCPGSCATVTSVPTGGTSPYTYTWSNGATTQNINTCPVSTTMYTVTIKDTGGKTSTSSAVVTINPAITVITTVSTINCSGGNGSITAAGAGGSSPYVYTWSTSGGSGSTVSGLTAGNYTVTITDSNGCTGTSTAVLISPPALIGQFIKGTASCAGCGCKEWLMVSATGGTSPYTYSWPDGYTNRYKNQLCPGNYTINIKDKNGCSLNVNLTAP